MNYLEAPPLDQAAQKQLEDLAAKRDTENEAEHDEQGAEVLMIDGVACTVIPRAGRGLHDAAVGADHTRIDEAGIRISRVPSIIIICYLSRGQVFQSYGCIFGCTRHRLGG